MSTVVVELYEALKQAGVNETLARDAASAVVPASALTDLATRYELKHEMALFRAEMKHELAASRLEMKSDMSELKAALIKWNVGAIVVLTTIFAAIRALT